MRLSLKAIKNSVRLLLVVVIGITLLDGLLTLPPARAAANPVDLQLGGSGATSWSITNVKPGDKGTKIVELLNTGTEDGFVSIWTSDIVNSEGSNPESETGNTAEPGEFADFLEFKLIAPGLVTSLNLPVTIYNLPQSANASNYINIIPVKAGTTVVLQWNWELPIEAGNDVQGDEISFTLNYLLREVNITSLAGSVTANGTFTEPVTVQSDNNLGGVTFSQGTTGRTRENQPLSEIWLVEIDQPPLSSPAWETVVGLSYEFGPDGATFDQPVTITLSYNPGSIPQGVNAGNLFIAVWDTLSGQWLPVAGSTVDAGTKTVSVPVAHFSRYTVLSPAPPPPPPPVASPPDEEEPEPAPQEKRKAVLEANILGSESTATTGADGSLQQPLMLTDPEGNFVIEFSRGTKITSVDGQPVTRIELTVIDETPAVAENIIVLSPKYRLTGYINETEIPLIVFNPEAKLSIRYDTRDLPENLFTPFIADYSAEGGLLPLPPAPGAIIELGQATAVAGNSGLFFVAAEILSPQPLPARFEAHSLTINPRQVYADESVSISFSITNNGDFPGTYEVYLMVDGIVRAIEEVKLDAMSSQTFRFEVANLSTGVHQVKVAGLTGEFEVTPLPVTTEEAEVDWFLIDISVIASLVAGALVLYIVVRRAHRLPITG